MNDPETIIDDFKAGRLSLGQAVERLCDCHFGRRAARDTLMAAYNNGSRT